MKTSIPNKIPGQVITFYSYKGGTGRTMALANIAYLLAKEQQGDKTKGILMVDWDLDAPGLHRFFSNMVKNYFSKTPNNKASNKASFEKHPGLIDIFWKLDEIIKNTKKEYNEETANSLFKKIDLDKFIINTDISGLYLLKAGKFDKKYPNRVNTFNWEKFFNRTPWLIRSFAELLSSKYQYILIDSRTGYTDISGICTMLMPEKLVIVFTPNRQNLIGLQDVIKQATSYRKQSDDLRPLAIFPLPSRIEMAELNLREIWRFGDKKKGIEGYQDLFVNLFKKVYGLPNCILDKYFDEVQIQHAPRYAYGEEIAVNIEKIDERLSLSRSYKRFTEYLVNLSGPWEDLDQKAKRIIEFPDETIERYEKSLKISKEIGDRSGEVNTLNDIGMKYWSMGKYNKALEYFEKGLKISREIGSRSGEGSALNNIGTVYRLWGRYDEALEYFEKGLMISRATGDRSGESSALNNIGSVYKSIGEYDKALEYFEKGLMISREIGNRIGEGTTVNNIGGVYESMGKYDKALEYFEKSLEITKETGGRSLEGVTLNNIGRVYKSWGKYHEALEYFEKSIEVREVIGDRSGEGNTLNNIGSVYKSIGEYDKALKYFERTLKVGREIGDRSLEGVALNNIGTVYQSRVEYDKALQYYEKSLKIRKEIGDLSGIDNSLYSIGLIYSSLNKHKNAIEYFNKSLKIQEQINNRYGAGGSLYGIGGVYESLGEYKKAIEYYSKSLNIFKEIDAVPEIEILSRKIDSIQSKLK